MTTDTPLKPNPAARWILLPFRILAAGALILYIFIGMSSTIDLYKRDLSRAQDISALYTVIDDAVQNKNLKAVPLWLKSRPAAETDRLVDMIKPKSPALEYSTFFEIAQRELQLGRTGEALFWLQLSRYRLRYDTIRCGAKPEAVKEFDPVFNFMQTPDTDELLREHPDMLKKSLQRVLDFDEKYPAHDDPALVCKILSVELPADEINWEGYRQMLRKRTADFIQSPDKEISK